MRADSDFLRRYHRNEEDFFKHIMSDDETWVSYVQLETKRQSVELHCSGSSSKPQQRKQIFNNNKLTTTVFWNLWLRHSFRNKKRILYNNTCPYTATQKQLLCFLKETFGRHPLFNPELAPLIMSCFLNGNIFRWVFTFTMLLKKLFFSSIQNLALRE